MMMMFIYGFLFSMLIVCLVSSDEIIDNGVKGNNLEKKDILRQFFSRESLSIDFSNPKVVVKYEDEIIEKMSKSLNNSLDLTDAYLLNCEVNSLIYKLELQEAPDPEHCVPFEPSHEAMLRALDLMVPDSAGEPIYRSVKKDMRLFYMEQPELAKELLDRLVPQLEATEFHTFDAARMLRNYYQYWIPLGRLVKLFDNL